MSEFEKRDHLVQKIEFALVPVPEIWSLEVHKYAWSDLLVSAFGRDSGPEIRPERKG